MSQDDYLFERLTKESERAKINQVLAAIVTNNSGDAEPTTTYPFQFWADTTMDLLKIRNEANSAWITIGSLTTANLGLALVGLITASGLTIGTGKIAGRTTASTGAIEALSLTQVLDLIGSAAQGDLLYRGASDWARLAAGTLGQVLLSQGAGANPAWGAPLLPNQGTVGVGVLKFGGLNVPQNATRYLGSLGVAPNATYTKADIVITRQVTISDMHVQLNAAVAASQSVVVTVTKNDIDTAITCTINAGSTTGSDIGNTATFYEGDSLNVKVVTSATFGSTTEIKATVKCTDLYGDFGVTPLRFGQSVGAANSAGEYSVNAGIGTEANVEVPLPSCVMKTYSVYDEDLGYSLGQWKWRRNAVSTNANAITTEGTLHPAYAANDLFNVRASAVGGTAVKVIMSEMQAVDPTQYPPCVMLFSAIGQTQNTTRYMTGYGVAAGTATESEVSLPMPACTVKNLRVAASAAPAAGQTIIATVRKNGVATALTVTITDSGRVFANTSDSVAFAAGDLFSLETVTSATSGTRSINACVETVE